LKAEKVTKSIKVTKIMEIYQKHKSYEKQKKKNYQKSEQRHDASLSRHDVGMEVWLIRNQILAYHSFSRHRERERGLSTSIEGRIRGIWGLCNVVVVTKVAGNTEEFKSASYFRYIQWHTE